MSRRACRLAVAGAAFLLAPRAASAHLETTGLGPVYDGIAHLLRSVEDLLPVVALALLAGLGGPRASRRALFVLPAAWLAGGLAGHQAGAAFAPAWIATPAALALGLLVAVGRPLPEGLVTALAGALGVLHGWLNGAGIAAAGREASGLVGIAAATFVLAALISARVVTLRATWARVAVRVAGSWIAAIGLLLAGWSLRPG